MKTFLENFAAALGMATVGLLLLSITHEYGYFWVVGSKFQMLLSTTDYFSNAILWIPFLVIVTYGYLDWDVLLGKRRYEIGRGWWNKIWFALMFGSPVVAFFFYEHVWIFTFILPAIWVWVAWIAGKLPYSNAEIEGQRLVHRAMVVTPVVALVSFGGGVTQGQTALETFDEPYQLELKQGIKINRIVLRTFDKGVLVRDPSENRIEFIKWEELQKLSRFAAAERNMPLSCQAFGINCPRPATNP
jgi:hypothetical protein